MEGSSSSARLRRNAIAHAQRWLERNDFVAVLVASLLPPPAPLKVFILTAGLLRVNAVHFGLALLVGRGLRFAAEAWLGARYGVQAEDYLRHNLGLGLAGSRDPDCWLGAAPTVVESEVSGLGGWDTEPKSA